MKIIKKLNDARAGDTQSVKYFFYVMVAIIVLSLAWVILSETLFKSEYKRPETVLTTSPTSNLSESFGGAVSSATSLVELMAIKSSIDSLMNKDTLSEADSIQLLKAFQQLEFINRQTNP